MDKSLGSRGRGTEESPTLSHRHERVGLNFSLQKKKKKNTLSKQKEMVTHSSTLAWKIHG